LGHILFRVFSGTGQIDPRVAVANIGLFLKGLAQLLAKIPFAAIQRLHEAIG
jgi:hypothetical protein